MKERGKVREVEVSEKELEALLVKDLSVIDSGLKYLGRQIATDSGVLDVLAFYEEDKSLAIIELKVREDDGQLFQAVGYYDWVKSRIDLIRRSYKKDIDVDIDPWVILVAPNFSENLKKATRYVDIPLNLVQYWVLDLPNGERYVHCEDVDYGEPYEPKRIPTIEGHVNYIIDEDARTVCANALSTLKEIGIEVQPRKRRLTLLRSADVVAAIRCRRQFFKIKSSLSGDWTDYKNIYTQKDWDLFFKKEIEPFV